MARRRSGSAFSPAPPLYDALTLKEDNFLGRKIAEARRSCGMTLDDLAAAVELYGMPVLRGGISKWEHGDTVPSAYQLLILCSIFDIDDPVAYFTGCQQFNDEGLRKISDYKADLAATGNYEPLKVSAGIRYICMPFSTLSASAGPGSFLDEGNFEPVNVPESSVPHGADFGLRIHGDSMEPIYTDGQTAWVKRCNQLNPGEVGIFTYDGEGYIKCYDEQEPEDPEAYTDSYGTVHMQPVLLSFNEAYAPIRTSPDKAFRIIGKVLN